MDDAAGTIARPPGTRLDLGGSAKGFIADRAAARLAPAGPCAADCGGDLRVLGEHAVALQSPFGGEPGPTLRLQDAAIATSGVDARAWGASAHHLLDPSTGRPAWTGVVTATALAPTAAEAEALAKAALLSGPRDGAAAARAPRRRAGPRRRDAALRDPRRRGAPIVRAGPGGGMTGRDPLEYGWWLAGRASGLVALALITLSVTLGLAMAGRVARDPRRRRAMLSVHEQTALAGLVAIAVHGVTLLGDRWLHPGPVGIAVPFAMDYRPVWTGLGILGAYLAAALGLSFYARRRIGAKRWRSLHRATILVYVLAVAHTLGAGSDAATPWLRAQLVLTGAPVLFLLVMRVLPAARVSAGARGARPGSAPSPAPRSARSRP